MIQFETFLDRFNYLKLGGLVGEATFGSSRWMNQGFYRSKDWRDLRHHIIARDEGCDLGHPDHEIRDLILIHHIIPITEEDVENSAELLWDPDNLVCVSHNTHNAIHFGDEGLLPKPYVARSPGDTKLW